MLQVVDQAKQAELNKEIDVLFDSWDNDASGVIDINFIECILSLYQPVPLADTIAQGMNLYVTGGVYPLNTLCKSHNVEPHPTLNPHTSIIWYISCSSRVIANFVLKLLPNFRYHDNKGRSGLNFSDTVKLPNVKNPQFGARF